jgi:hypothetical protein
MSKRQQRNLFFLKGPRSEGTTKMTHARRSSPSDQSRQLDSRDRQLSWWKRGMPWSPIRHSCWPARPTLHRETQIRSDVSSGRSNLERFAARTVTPCRDLVAGLVTDGIRFETVFLTKTSGVVGTSEKPDDGAIVE